MPRKIARIFGWVLLGILGIALLLYVIALGINWRDQPPSVAAIKLRRIIEERPAVPDADNGFVYIMGFSAPKDRDPQEVGVRRVKWLKQSLQEGSVAQDDPVPIPRNLRDGLSQDLQTLLSACQPAGSKCVALLESEAETVPAWLNSGSVPLTRYRSLITCGNWLEVVPFDISLPLPAYADVMDGQRLHLLDLLQRSSGGDAHRVQEALRKDIVFWRRVLEHSDLLITKMIATAALRQHFALGNLVLRSFPPDQVLNAVPAEWRQELSAAERSMLRTAAGELLFSEGTLRNAENFDVGIAAGMYDENAIGSRLAHLLSMPLYQPQDSLNTLAEKYVRSADAFAVPLAQYPTALERTSSEQAPSRSFGRLYNIIGNVIFDVRSDWNPGTYAVRVGDIEGLRRVALLAAELRSASVPRADVADRLRVASLRNPYNDQPFQWSEEEQAIVFVGLSEGERKKQAYLY